MIDILRIRITLTSFSFRLLIVLCVLVLQTGQVIVDGWLKLTAPAQIAVLFKELRTTLHTILKDLIRNPEVPY